MLTIRKADERGRTQIGWLDGRHSFSFGEYFDPDHHHFRTLRVINDDHVSPGGGFPTHPHRDMEILTYVISGALEHKDSTGGGGVIRPGDVQFMSAGKGVFHSEFNHSKSEPVHLLQIWITPREKGLQPTYDQKHFPESERAGALRPVATPDGREGSLEIRQDASMYASVLTPGQRVRHQLAAGRGAWIQVASGGVTVNGHTLTEGDGLAIENEAGIEISGAAARSEVILFDLA
ncbi:MAG: pirin family protein [Phycisphaerales bacterium]|nr:pirin family protein [Phycisphaerales bacterium]